MCNLLQLLLRLNKVEWHKSARKISGYAALDPVAMILCFTTFLKEQKHTLDQL